MNELSNLFLNINDGDTVLLEKNKTYHVSEDDSFEKHSYFCSNTAKKNENPDGMRKCAVFLKDKNNIEIDGNGAEIIVHGKMTPFLFDNCKNITVRNLTVDYACPTMSEFTVVSNENGCCVLKINRDCLFRLDGNDLIWYGEANSDDLPYWEDSYNSNKRYFKVYNPKTKQCSDFRRDNIEFEKAEQIDDYTLKVYFKNKNVPLPEGCVVQTRNIIRDQTGSLFQRCKNLVFENLRIKFMHGLGMVSQFCENVTFRNCDFTPNENRTIASTADFFQFSGCKGKIIIDSCKAYGAHDDYVNVHGTHLRVVEKNDESSIIVRFMHAESWGFQAFDVDDEIEFIKWDTLIPYFKTKVVSFERLNDTDIKLVVENLPTEIEIEKDVVENITWTPDLRVANCVFSQTSGRGILCTTRGDVIIESNIFTNLWGPALLIEDDCNFWFESGYTKNIIFRNNKITSCDYASTFPGAPTVRYSPKVLSENPVDFVHGKLSITGNRFEKAKYQKHLIHLEHLREAEIKENFFDAEYEIETYHVGNVLDENNSVN